MVDYSSICWFLLDSVLDFWSLRPRGSGNSLSEFSRNLGPEGTDLAWLKGVFVEGCFLILMLFKGSILCPVKISGCICNVSTTSITHADP